MNIPELWVKFKSLMGRVPDEASIVAIIVLVSLSSFGLGRLSALESQREGVRILGPQGSPVSTSTTRGSELPQARMPGATQTASARDGLTQVQTGNTGEVVASKNGTKYHLPWCSGAKRISEANKITFPSKAEAEKAGYTAAANCPGL